MESLVKYSLINALNNYLTFSLGNKVDLNIKKFGETMKFKGVKLI